MDGKEIVHSALQIERASADRNYGDMSTVLGELDKMHITAEQLETTDVARVLYQLLKTCPDGNVKKAARALLSRWKKQYSKARVKCTGSNAELPCRSDDLGGEGVCVEEEATSSGTKDGLQTLSVTAAGTTVCSSFSSIRSKCVQLLFTSLCPELPDHDKAAKLARAIEHHIHQCHNSNQLKYKACVRSKVANLRNLKSQHLRQGLLNGLLSPEAFVQMSMEEMAGAELRQLREEYSSSGVSERQLPQGVEGTQTHKIRCKRCGGMDCKVTQVARGALFLPAWVKRGGPDEDAMTFVTCSRCGQQWYHSSWICL